jgi:cell filamentation protein, protein adenylyltransferase
MSTPAGGNRYEYPNGTLRNTLGITDAAHLQQVETTLTALRLLEVVAHPISGLFDLDHLKAIHHAIFQDIYAWAGEIRQVDMSKGNSPFAHVAYLASNAQTLFARLAQEQYLRGLPPDQFARRAAYYLGEINVLHPFREGNGRTQRVFFTELARQAGYTLDWTQISAKQMLDASILSLVHGDNSEFEHIFLTMLTPLQP